jgi:hypothetical protein
MYRSFLDAVRMQPGELRIVAIASSASDSHSTTIITARGRLGRRL